MTKENLEAEYRKLPGFARRVVERSLGQGALTSEREPVIPQAAGVFVSIHRQGELRGCIGTFQPRESNVVEETRRNALAAANHDPRFPPVGREELGGLHFSVDVLSQPEPISSVEQLDPKRYGVIVQSGLRRGLLLPDLEGVDTPEQQIAISRRKAMIGPDEPVQLYRFEVRRFPE